FGTIRSRTEYHLYNAESLKSQTKIEYFAIDKNSRQVIVKPTVSAFESQYQEKYILWTGPFKTVKTVKSADPLMVDFSDISPNSNISGSLNNDFQNEENQTGELPSNEVIKNRRR
ncbi:MAG: adhesin, partial [Neisseriaceae bacterium]|nr:adhesin [Neisseriaceae bacterium]